MKIYYLANKWVNPAKWDKAIFRSFNGNIYGFSWYLDRVVDRWDALIEGDYERVMPLPVRRKYSVDYVYSPFLCQQLGVYSTKSLDAGVVADFLAAIPKKYRLVDYPLNSFNPLPEHFSGARAKPNYQLDLIPPYEQLQKGYANNTRRNIKKAEKEGIQVFKNISPGAFMSFLREHLKSRDRTLTDVHFTTINKVVTHALAHRIGDIYGGFDKHNQPVAMAFWVRSHQKATYLLATSSPEGLQQSAMFVLIDAFIKQYAGKNMTLDFEGSVHEGIARFYQGFGSQPVMYHHYHENRLPALLRLLKK